MNSFEDDDDEQDTDWNDAAPRGSLVSISGTTLQLHHDGIGETYDIALARIRTPQAMLCWLEHLSAKTWITRQHLREFLRTVAAHHGWALHPVP